MLKKTIDYNPQEDGAYGLMLTLGPGFCNEMVLLRWREGTRKC